MPRMSIEVGDALNDRLDKFLPWGTKQRVMLALAENLCEAVEKHGKKIVGLILNNEWNLVTQEITKKKEDESGPA